MASDVELVNNALALLGDAPIISLGDDTARARTANVIFGVTRDAVLRAHPWNCAIERQECALLVTAPLFGWNYQFTLPVDPYCLRVLALDDDEECGNSGRVFKVEGRRLMTNNSTAQIKYIKRVTDPNEYDTILYEALSARLAAKLAYVVTGSGAMIKGMMELYDGFLREARIIDAQEGTPDRTDINTFLDVR